MWGFKALVSGFRGWVLAQIGVHMTARTLSSQARKERSPNLDTYFKSSNVGALIIRIGFLGFLIITIAEYTPNPTLISKALNSAEMHIRGPLLHSGLWGLLRSHGLGFRV